MSASGNYRGINARSADPTGHPDSEADAGLDCDPMIAHADQRSSGHRQREPATRRSLVICLVLVALHSPGLGATSAAEVAAEIHREQVALEDLLTRYTEKHPDVIAARARLAVLGERRRQRALQEPVPRVDGAAAPTDVQSVLPRASAAVAPAPRPLERERRRIEHEDDFNATCARPGIVACYDFEGTKPLSSKVGKVAGELTPGADGMVRARLVNAGAAGGGQVVRMDFRAADGADHGAFVFHQDSFAEGDRLTVQWRQWFTSSLITRFDSRGAQRRPTVGGDGPKQVSISEMGDPQGCSFGDIVIGNAGWLGTHVIYHGCGLWYRPMVLGPAGPEDPTDMDVQPGGDNVCRYRYYGNLLDPGVDFLYPTQPRNLLEVPSLGAIVHPARYHGCLGIEGGQWMTFRLELDISFCRALWTSPDAVPEPCRATSGRLRYWAKFADDERPWLVYDYPMPLRWQPGHSERYGRFMFTPYNTNETPRAGKPLAYTMYNDILIARNVSNLPWPHR